MDILSAALALPDPWDRDEQAPNVTGWDKAQNALHAPRTPFLGVPTHPQLDRLVRALGADVAHVNTDEDPVFKPYDNRIEMPYPDAFTSPDMYARTLAHELGHWTAQNGVSRTFEEATIFDQLFGDHGPYGTEEMTAETSVYLSAELLGIAQETVDWYSLHYIRAWLENVSDPRGMVHDPRALFNRALPNARRIVEFYRSNLA